MDGTRERSGGDFRRRLFSPRVWLCAAVMLSIQLLAYCGTQPLLEHMTIHNLATPLDVRIPFIPEWVIVYCLAYASWAVSGFVILSQDKDHAYRFAAAYGLGMIAAGAIFLIWPGTLDRPEITGGGLCRELLRQIYRVDSPAYNLCPSLHAMVSYFCWRGLWGCRRVPAWFKAFNLVFFLLVCLSILFVKQHVLIDIPAAIAVGEGALQAARVFRLERVPRAIERRFTGRWSAGRRTAGRRTAGRRTDGEDPAEKRR